jgi:hypothetical protein
MAVLPSLPINVKHTPRRFCWGLAPFLAIFFQTKPSKSYIVRPIIAIEIVLDFAPIATGKLTTLECEIRGG